MRARNWAIFIVVNIIVSAAVMLTVLIIWERMETPPPPSPTPASTPVPAEDATSVPSAISPSASPAIPERLVYVIQEGDTLGAIAQAYNVSMEDLMAANNLTDPNVLHVGQTLTIPAAPLPSSTSSSAEATPPESSPPGESPGTPLPTLTPAGPSLVEIGQVLGAGDLTGEVVVIRNRGGAVSLEGWVLSDAQANIFTFPKVTLFADVQMRVHSAPGRSTPSDLYWGRSEPAWSTGELITLRNKDGNVVDTYIVP